MRMVIAGGGQVGRNLAMAMFDKRHTVSLIENNKDKCRSLANEMDAQIICGDCTTISVLETAGIKDADCFMAVTGVDQDNLVASQLAMNYFGAKKVIARANDPRNLKTFRLLGIEYVVSSTEIITRIIEQDADLTNMHILASLSSGKGSICTMTLSDNTIHHGRSLMDIKLPKGSLVVSIVRNGSLIIPDGSSMLLRGDEIITVCEEKLQKQLMKILNRKNR